MSTIDPGKSPTFTLDEALAGFAECWTRGETVAAIGFARLAHRRTHQANPLLRYTRSTPGCPEADEAVGWLGWAGNTNPARRPEDTGGQA